VLGVRTQGPREARRLVINPRLGDLDAAEGTTLTEFGAVSVQWRRDEKRALSLEIDNGATVPAIVSLRLPGTKTSLIVDGKPLLHQGAPTASDVTVHDGQVRFPLNPGKHSGRLAGE
jgi:hypothetical protein